METLAEARSCVNSRKRVVTPPRRVFPTILSGSPMRVIQSAQVVGGVSRP